MRRCVQESLVVGRKGAVGLPKRLEDLSVKEIERKRCIGRVMTYVLKYLTDEFTANKFEWFLPVIFSQTTDPLWPDQNASIEQRVEVEIYGQTVRPTASMIVHKIVACSLAYPRLFVLSPNVRIERRERAATGVHAYEFTQLDFEVRNATSGDVRDLVEKAVCGLMEGLKAQMTDELDYLRTSGDLKIPVGRFRIYDKRELEKEYGPGWESQIVLEERDPIWVTNLPREFYDFEDFETGIWDNYDLLLPRFGEVLSGARREFEYDKIVKKMERDGVRKENYGTLLSIAKAGRLKPSAGGGIGLERLVSWLVEAEHVGEVQQFPRVPGTIREL